MFISLNYLNFEIHIYIHITPGIRIPVCSFDTTGIRYKRREIHVFNTLEGILFALQIQSPQFN